MLNKHRFIVIIATQLILLSSCNSSISSKSSVVDVGNLSNEERKCLMSIDSDFKNYISNYSDFKNSIQASDDAKPEMPEERTNLASSYAAKSEQNLNKLFNMSECQSVKEASKIKDIVANIANIIKPLRQTTSLLIKLKQKDSKELMSWIKDFPFDSKYSSETDIMIQKFIKYNDAKIEEIRKILPNISDNCIDTSSCKMEVERLNAENVRLKKIEIEKEQIITVITNDNINKNKEIIALRISILAILVSITLLRLFIRQKNIKKASPQKPVASSTLVKPPKSSKYKNAKADLSRFRSLKALFRLLLNFMKYLQKLSQANSGSKAKRSGLGVVNSERSKADITENKLKINENSSIEKPNVEQEEISESDLTKNDLNNSNIEGRSNQLLYRTLAYELKDDLPIQKKQIGYFSATEVSLAKNRTYSESPLELVESDKYYGLYWIIQTSEPYYLLFPNPEKRIDEARMQGIGYFFDHNFHGDDYHRCILLSPAFMSYENGKLVRQQLGEINFVYS